MTQLILLPKSFRRIALLAFLCTIVGLSFSQCKRETTAPEGNTFKCPIKAVIGNENDILGRWKLMEVSAMSRSDYSCNEIIYDFRQDGSLFVGSNLANYAAQPPGSYFYQLEKKAKGDQIYFKLKIDGLDRGDCSISKDKMTIIGEVALDGPIKICKS